MNKYNIIIYKYIEFEPIQIDANSRKEAELEAVELFNILDDKKTPIHETIYSCDVIKIK